ncbi:MAG: hypothetical protein ACYC1M_19095 [Armatimonadota bacterium]
MTVRLADDIYSGLAHVPLIDAHTHLVDGALGARGLHDIMLYHMAISDLYAAGCPSGGRLTQYPDWPSDEDAHSRIIEALPYLPHTRNTSISWGIRTILRDLYGIGSPVDASNWRYLDSMIRERADDTVWHTEVAKKAGIKRFGTEIARRRTGSDDALLSYALEWAFFTRCQWGEYDTALYELERCWGKLPGPPAQIGGGARPATDKAIRSLADVHSAMDWYVQNIPADMITSMATHISTDIALSPVSASTMETALSQREYAGASERDIYASYINELFLTALERHNKHHLVFQFSLGAEPLPYETGSRLSQNTIAQLAEMISRHPNIHFQCFLSSLHANQSLCTVCRELPNLSLAGYWWHNFFPSSIRQVMSERLDMLPVNKQIGFFSDAYCVEWAYAKAVIVRKQLATVLAQKIEDGQYDRDEALGIARDILFESPQQLNHITPSSIL